MTETTITKSVILTAPRQTVWEYLTNAEKLGQWFHSAESDLEQGKDYALIEQNDDGSSQKIIWGRVLEMDRPSKLVYTFTIKPMGGAMTTVTWELQEVHGGTKLSLSHEGIDQAAGEAAMGLLLALDAGWAKHIMKLRGVIIPAGE